uniref:Uncharacterized protein n=1 Tax=Glossina palpalis gambiensis TaxID=67801 RepID=A0A1B0B4Q0_9MUSC
MLLRNCLSDRTPANIKYQQLSKNNGNNLWAIAAFDAKLVDKHLFNIKAFGTPFNKRKRADIQCSRFPLR